LYIVSFFFFFFFQAEDGIRDKLVTGVQTCALPISVETGSLAYSQLAFLPFLQLASITGPWGMSFVLLLFSTAIAIWMHLRSSSRSEERRVGKECRSRWVPSQ